MPLDGGSAFREQLRRWWLVAIGLIGLGMLAAAVAVDLWTHARGIWSDLLLNTGSGVLLFAVLFWAERRLVVRQINVQTEQLIQSLTGRPDQLAELGNDPDSIDLPRRFERDQQIGVAIAFLEALGSSRFEDAWQLADADWRRCRVQAWLWNNRDHFGSDESVLDEMTESILNDTTSRIARDFMDIERKQFAEVWGGIDSSKYGAASRRRIVGPAYEVVVLIPLDGYPDGLIVRAETMVRGAIIVLVHWTDAGWKVATIGAEAAPRPGWPPSWWMRHDPASIRWFEEAGPS